MAIPYTCTCGRLFEFSDQFAGQEIDCPDCKTRITVPAAPARALQAEAVFERDTFLINQKFRIDEKYAVTDEAGRELMFVVRPRHFLRSLASLFVGILAGTLWAGLCFTLVGNGTGILAGLLSFIGMVGLFAVTVLVAASLMKKRHTTFYRDEAMGLPLMEILQDKKLQFITQTYTVRDGEGKVLAHLRKNWLYNFIRKRWYMDGPDGREIAMAMEDSALKAFLRRFIGPLFGLLRTNFEIQSGDSDRVVGMFNRRFTLLDRYVLDLSADPERTMDRRLALALGVMLDTGERR